MDIRDVTYLSSNIKYLRKSDGLTQARLSEILGYKSLNTVEKWEAGKNMPPLDTMIRLSEFFEVSLDDLVFTDLQSFSPLSGTQAKAAAMQEALLRAFSEASPEAKDIVLYILKVNRES